MTLITQARLSACARRDALGLVAAWQDALRVTEAQRLLALMTSPAA